ncbi:MAG TPA: hypothetical protein VME40_08465, partial [Caulobacteraceae bacterium]|nr:hypothetical protein [Caulobacteraceae bacterium]
MGGVALTAFTPAVALASCTPTPAGTTAGAAANAQGVQTCGAGDPGVYYNATGNLNLDFTGEAVAPNGVGVTNGGAWNVILGINTTTETAGNIANTGGVGISLNGGTGGDVELDTGSAALGSFAGATVTGSTDGIDTSTGGAGTTKVNVYNTVTGASGNGISVIAGTGAVTVNAMTNTGGGVTVTGGGTAGISVFGGGAVTISAPGNTTGATYGIYSVLAGGPTTVTAGNTSGLDAIVVQNSAGDVTINSNGTATGGSQFIAISALTGSGNVTVTTKDVVNGIDAGGATNGLVTITTNGNVTGANGVTVDNGAGGGMAGSASVTLNGNVNNNATPTFYGTGVSINTSGGGGGITLTSAAGTDISSSNGSGVVLTSDTGNIVANLSGTVGGAEQVAGDGIDATTAVVFSKSTISITTAGVNAADNGIVASNGGSGFTSVTVNGNVTGASGVGIKATTLTENPANGTGADTVTLAGNVSVTAGGDGIDMSVDLYGNATLTLGANNTISAGGNGVDVQGFGTGAITIGTATKDDQSGLIQTTGFLTDGIVAQQGATATGGIDIDFGGNIEATGFFGGS